MKTITTTDNKITLFQIVKKYLFRDKKYPVLLYNLYGSEGHDCDRYIVDRMIKEKGFWRTAFNLINSK